MELIFYLHAGSIKHLLMHFGVSNHRHIVLYRQGIPLCYQNRKRHRKTSNTRIRKIFGKHLGRYRNDNKLLRALKANPEAFFNQVYGERGGNGLNDGFKYRGRGFNQLTFKNNYRRFSYHGVN